MKILVDIWNFVENTKEKIGKGAYMKRIFLIVGLVVAALGIAFAIIRNKAKR